MTIELTEQESQVLLNLLDVAVKAAGINAAEAALHFAKKIEAAKANNQPKPTEQ